MSDAAEVLRRVFAETIGALTITLEGAIAEALLDAPPITHGSVRAVAIGKSAPAMMQGARAAWGDRIVESLIVCPDETPAPPDAVRASHPLPDARSVAAAERALDLASRVGPDDVLLALVSGGASALACAPAPGVSLDDKIAVTRAMLRSGADIVAINVVRRHLSRIKGGGLARAATARGGRVVTCVAIDVIGGELNAVGSGPTMPDASSAEAARALLWQHAPAFAKLPLVDTLSPGDPVCALLRTWPVIYPDALAGETARRLEEHGIAVRLLAPSEGTVEQLVAEYAAAARQLAPGAAIVRVAEPTLRVTAPSPGRGGRSSHLAALVARHLPEGVAFLAGASDGADGTSGTAGAVVDGSFVDRAGGPHVYGDRLASFDSASLHAAAGTALSGRPTGLNLCDVHALVRARRA